MRLAVTFLVSTLRITRILGKMDGRNEESVKHPTGFPFVFSSTGSMELAGVQKHQSVKLSHFESLYRQPEDSPYYPQSLKECAVKTFSKLSWKHILKRNFPTLSELNKYKVTQDLPNDIIAGLTAGITMIPQGMAFAALANLPPIVGLYISLFASITYFFLGTAHQLSWGCVAVLSIMIGNILDKYESTLEGSLGGFASCGEFLSSPITRQPDNSTSIPQLGMFENDSLVATSVPTSKPELVSVEQKMEVAGAVSLISGVILAVLGKLGLGKITSYMSDSLVTSFTIGVSVHVVSSQLKTVLGLSFPRQNGVFKLVKHWMAMLSNIHHTNLITIIISVLSIACIYSVKRFINEKYKAKMRIPVPVELLVVIMVTLITTFTKLNETFAVDVVEDIPVGVPKPRIPDLSLGMDYITDGMVIIIISFTQTVAMAKLIGLKYNCHVDSDQEMFACGVVSAVCAIFSGYISGASVSRSLVQDSAGGKTQVASLFAAGLVLLVIMLIGPYFYYLPKCVLAAIVIVNLRSVLLTVLCIPDLCRKSYMDALVWIITFVATVILDADFGLLIGVIASLLLVLINSQIASVSVLGQVLINPLVHVASDTVDGTGGCTHKGVNEHTHVWKPKDKYYGTEEISGVKVLRINNPIYFVNAEIVTDLVFKNVGVNPLKKKKELFKKTKVERKLSDTIPQDKNDATMYLPDRDTLTSMQLPNQTLETENSKRDDEPELHYKQSFMLPKYDDPSDKYQFSTIVLDLSGVSFIDLMGVSALEFLMSEFKKVDVNVYISSAHEKCFETLDKSGFMKKHDSQVFVTTEAAISQAKQRES